MTDPLGEISTWGIQLLQQQLTDIKSDLILPQYSQLWNEITQQFTLVEKQQSKELSAQKKRLVESYPEFREHLIFLELIITNYPDLLYGKQSILHFLFPKGSFNTIACLYESNPIANFYNNLVANVMGDLVQREFKIIELGAGIGATTKKLLPTIKEYSCSYTYTDISKAFLVYGKANIYDDENLLQFSLFNINKAVHLQDLPLNQYNIIIASDVLHNATNIITSLKELNKLLKPGMYLIINETTQKNNYSTLIFGLTMDWWNFKDPEYRIPGSPLLTSAMWKFILTASGFENIKIYFGESKKNLYPMQTVLVAQKTG